MTYLLITMHRIRLDRILIKQLQWFRQALELTESLYYPHHFCMGCHIKIQPGDQIMSYGRFAYGGGINYQRLLRRENCFHRLNKNTAALSHQMRSQPSKAITPMQHNLMTKAMIKKKVQPINKLTIRVKRTILSLQTFDLNIEH